MDLSLMTVLMLVYLSDCNCLYQEKTSRFNSLQLAKSVSKVMLQDISRIAENQQGRTRTRHRRAIGLCGLSESDVLEMNPQDLNEKAEGIQAVWVGRDELMIIASDKVQSGHSTIWRGTPTSYGVFRFKSDSSSITDPVMADSLQVSPAGNRAIVVVVSLNKRYIHVSKDYAKTWNRYNSPTSRFDSSSELYLSGFNPQHMVIRGEMGELWVSVDCGQHWNFITKKVQLVEFAQAEEGKEFMYYSTASNSNSFNPLHRMDIASQHSSVIDNSAYRFRVDNHFLFVSRKNATGNKAADERSRRLYVTDNYISEKVRFVEVQLPSLLDEQFYVVMATHETGAFIHVYQGSDSNFGSLYVSDSTGSRFSLSLPNHLYQVYNLAFGHYSVHDFYEVKSTRGVYITTAVDPVSNGHVTKITFNNGGLWSRLTPPTGSCSGSSCSLHLHLHYSQVVSPFLNSSTPNGPFSIESAPLIILAHGTIGEQRNDNGHDTKVYLSNDGGYTWKDIGLPAGTYAYGIADYGNIIAIAPDAHHVQSIWFSHDRGDCFRERTVDTTGVFQLNRGLIFDPSAASLFGFLMGVEGTGENDEWRVITLDFMTLLKTPCHASEYTLVVEHMASSDCLMGQQRSFNLTKKTSICYNDKNYNYFAVHQTPCPCSFSDFECDYGYTHESVNKCVWDPRYHLSDLCPPGSSTYKQSQTGFVLVPGDTCSPTDDSDKLLYKETKLCTGNENNSGFKVHHRNVGLTVFLTILIVALAMVLASILLFVWLRCRSKELARDRVYYQRLPQEMKNNFAEMDASSSDEDIISAT